MKGPIRTLVVDDESLARENLRIRLAEVPDVVIIGECATGPEALEKIREDRPDLVFLDIQMPGQDGFGLLEQLSPEETPLVVFVTAYDEYAVRAFKIHALDYVLKPFDSERLGDTLAQVREKLAMLRDGAHSQEGKAAENTPLPRTARGNKAGQVGEGGDRNREYLERLVIKMGGRVFFVRSREIDWVQADGDYMRLYIGSRTHLLRKTMNELETCLDPRQFVRIHRSVIVNVDRIEELRPDARGDFRVSLSGGVEVKLTRTYRHRLESLLGDYI